MTKWRSIPAVWTAVPLILLFFWLALHSMALDSPTMDEQNHLARGIAFWRSGGDPRLSLEHPPLVNSLSALPLLTLPDVVVPFDHPSWVEMSPPDIYWYVFAEELLWHANQDVTRMIFLGRLPVIFLTIGLGLVGFHFARELWGDGAGLLALFLLLFEPNILAHGRLITTDLGGALFSFLALYLLWRLWQTKGWNWRRWLWVGVALGLAFGSKLSTLGFLPILGVLALLPLYPPQPGPYWQTAGRHVMQLGTAVLLSLLITWIIFGFEWGPFRFPSETLQFLNSANGPMPTFWAGLDQILNVSRGGRAAFLLGEFSDEGFPLYFPVAFLVKTPLAILIALPSAAIVLLWQRQTRQQALYLLIPALYYFGLSMWSGVNIGYRHLLPILPLLLVLISGLVAGGKSSEKPITDYRARFTNYGLPVTAYALAAIFLLETLTIHPHYLSFFNVVAGGPANGPRLLADSNVDWGQDLRRLQIWMAENEVESVKLGWFGTAVPAYYGLNYEPLPGFPRPEFYSLWNSPPFDPAQPEPGIYAISASSLWESHWANKTVYPWFRAREPDDRVGYSIWIYRVIE
ncbi:MAG: glycosyltransferase family 39 protein [Anaerolineae bacterium]|nr:glycosyltransferase family 39 protein [Anaerolineae bacterium]